MVALEDPLVDIKAETMRETSWISRKISIPAGDRRHKKLFMANFLSNPALIAMKYKVDRHLWHSLEISKFRLV